MLNTTAALCSAYATNAPVLCLTGQIPSEGIGKGVGYLHELPDQLATLKSLTKWAGRIESPSVGPAMVNQAFGEMLSGRPRPVALEMPPDIMAQTAEVQLLPSAPISSTPQVDMDGVDRAAAMLADAKRPLIVAGGGALDAASQLREFAETLQAPVVTFRNGRGVVSDRHYLSVNLPCGYELWRDADVVVRRWIAYGAAAHALGLRAKHARHSNRYR